MVLPACLILFEYIADGFPVFDPGGHQVQFAAGHHFIPHCASLFYVRFNGKSIIFFQAFQFHAKTALFFRLFS